MSVERLRQLSFEEWCESAAPPTTGRSTVAVAPSRDRQPSGGRRVARPGSLATARPRSAAFPQLQLLTPSPGAFADHTAIDASPISPSFAGFGCESAESKTVSDHQLYFGADAADASSASALYDDEQRAAGLRHEDSSGVSSFAASDCLSATHRTQHPFAPRHDDEIRLELGDALRVDHEGDDHWCRGTNMRTNQSGIFPSACVFEVDVCDEIGIAPDLDLLKDERDTFYLSFLGSVEVAHHKGNDVLVQAINKVLRLYSEAGSTAVLRSVLVEVSFRGLHMIDKSSANRFKCPRYDYFYALQNISFCGAHPKQMRYFGFITKHPLLPRFACHVFASRCATQPIVEAIGRAFKRSYDEYMAFAHPTEDIFLE